MTLCIDSMYTTMSRLYVYNLFALLIKYILSLLIAFLKFQMNNLGQGKQNLSRGNPYNLSSRLKLRERGTIHNYTMK